MTINKRLLELVLTHRIITKDYNTKSLIVAINKSGIFYGRISFLVKTKAKKLEQIRKAFDKTTDFTHDMSIEEFEILLKDSECVDKCQDGYIVWEL